MARTNPPHAIGALREVPESHVLAKRERRARVRRLLDVGARSVDVVEKAEATLGRDAAPLQAQHRAPRGEKPKAADRNTKTTVQRLIRTEPRKTNRA